MLQADKSRRLIPGWMSIWARTFPVLGYSIVEVGNTHCPDVHVSILEVGVLRAGGFGAAVLFRRRDLLEGFERRTGTSKHCVALQLARTVSRLIQLQVVAPMRMHSNPRASRQFPCAPMQLAMQLEHGSQVKTVKRRQITLRLPRGFNRRPRGLVDPSILRSARLASARKRAPTSSSQRTIPG